MYTANPRVNVELRQRLPPPETQQPSNSTKEPSNSTKEPSNSTKEPSNSTQQPSNSTQQPSNSTQQPPCAGLMDVDVSPSRGSSPWAEMGGDVPDVSGGHMISADHSSHQEVVCGPITASGPVFDRDKNVSFLLKELDTLREINKKLQEDLVQKETELQRRELEEELRGGSPHWERPAAVLAELLAAQKDRDQAVMSRLLLANEERDEALLRARQLQQLETFPLENADMDVGELLQRVCGADSARDVQQLGSALVQRLRSARQRRSDITAQEMKAVMDERDCSVAKCKRLEQEVMREREQRAREMELLRLQKERGGAMEDRRWLEAELQLLRANHSDSVSPAASLVAANQTPLRAPPQETPSLHTPPPETPALQEQVQQLWKEKQSVAAELQRCQEAEREARERVRRLERLVEVLRKKVGTGSLRAVI